MLITFKSPAAPDVVMLDNLAQLLLGMIGKRLGDRGVVHHDEMADCIDKLEAAIGAAGESHVEHGVLHHDSDHEHDVESRVGLKQRAYPFLDMMRLAQAQNADILWGV